VNMVVSAPTGSGKTVLFELCILRLLSRFLTPEWRFSLVKGTLKTVRADLPLLRQSWAAIGSRGH
jgi:ATP-dependent DNA helicase HFM1/MER3